MERIALGEAAAYRILVDRHAGRLLGFAERLLGDRATAEDVVQDGFLSVWRTAASWSPRARVTTWLYRIVRNKAFDQLRRRRPQVDPEQVVLVDPGGEPDRVVSERETARAVRAALDGLPERQRSAIVLIHYEQLSGAEAASALGVSVEALESLLARGRRRLRRLLVDRRAEILEDR